MHFSVRRVRKHQKNDVTSENDEHQKNYVNTEIVISHKVLSFHCLVCKSQLFNKNENESFEIIQ